MTNDDTLILPRRRPRRETLTPDMIYPLPGIPVDDDEELDEPPPDDEEGDA